MITRQFGDLLSAYENIVDELAYEDTVSPLKWGVCLGYPDVVEVKIDDILIDNNLHLGMASYTKSRWTRFLRRYFREDLSEWVEEAVTKLQKYPSRPFVASYSVNLTTGHNYGGCLSSLQIRICPRPTVILYSRACHIDKIGFLDLTLMHIIAKEMVTLGVKGPIEAQWVISNGFISAISQIFYLVRFKRPMDGHRLQRTMKRLYATDYEDIKFGPLKRGRARIEALKEHGEIPRSRFVKDLGIDYEVFQAKSATPVPETDDEAEEWLEMMGDIG